MESRSPKRFITRDQLNNVKNWAFGLTHLQMSVCIATMRWILCLNNSTLGSNWTVTVPLLWSTHNAAGTSVHCRARSRLEVLLTRQSHSTKHTDSSTITDKSRRICADSEGTRINQASLRQDKWRAYAFIFCCTLVSNTTSTNRLI
jgi:hypothetical protein